MHSSGHYTQRFPNHQLSRSDCVRSGEAYLTVPPTSAAQSPTGQDPAITSTITEETLQLREQLRAVQQQLIDAERKRQKDIQQLQQSDHQQLQTAQRRSQQELADADLRRLEDLDELELKRRDDLDHAENKRQQDLHDKEKENKRMTDLANLVLQGRLENLRVADLQIEQKDLLLQQANQKVQQAKEEAEQAHERADQADEEIHQTKLTATQDYTQLHRRSTKRNKNVSSCSSPTTTNAFTPTT